VSVNQPFETVVAVHGPAVLRVCRAVLGPADADDAWSETFLSAMKAYPDLARLPGRQKQAVAYPYLAGLPYTQVAAILGGSTAAARRAAADGIAALRHTYPGAPPGQEKPGE
jgi:DNA-directed RNA polymerase specialized sigma24 family protein